MHTVTKCITYENHFIGYGPSLYDYCINRLTVCTVQRTYNLRLTESAIGSKLNLN
jgi:hypothetical protein